MSSSTRHLTWSTVFFPRASDTINITQSNLSADIDPVMDSELFLSQVESAPIRRCCIGIVWKSFSQSNQHLWSANNLQGSYQAIEKVSRLFRVRLIDKLFSSSSQELSLVPVAQLNSDVDERVVIVPWIEAVRERATAELSVWERTIDLLKHAVAPNSRRPSLFPQLRSHFLNSHFRPAIAVVFSVSFFELHLLSVFVSFFYSSSFFHWVYLPLSIVFRVQGSRVQVISERSSDKWEVKWYLVIRSPRGVITERWLAEWEKEPRPELQGFTIIPFSSNCRWSLKKSFSTDQSHCQHQRQRKKEDREKKKKKCQGHLTVWSAANKDFKPSHVSSLAIGRRHWDEFDMIFFGDIHPTPFCFRPVVNDNYKITRNMSLWGRRESRFILFGAKLEAVCTSEVSMTWLPLTTSRKKKRRWMTTQDHAKLDCWDFFFMTISISSTFREIKMQKNRRLRVKNSKI